MKKITNKLLFTIAAVIFSIYANAAGNLTGKLLIAASLNGSQQVPAVVTSAVGVGSFTLNATQDSICVNISVNGLSGPITEAHIHEGAVGVNGSPVIDLTPYVSGNRITTILTGTNVTKAIVAKILSGAYYVNVHTSAHPDGEIRGQLVLETDWGFSADLNGAQQVPAVVTNAYGLGTFKLSNDRSKLKFTVVVQGLSGAITGVHFHKAPAGATGDVIVDLQTYASGNVVVGEIDPTAYLSDLLAGNIYINFHTAANPNGEIRGQLKIDNKLVFESWLDGTQQVPPVTTTARGIASLKLNTTADTLWYDVVADGLSGAILTSHFHEAAPGIAGQVLVDIGTSISGNRIKGYITTPVLTNALITKFLKGDVYVNLHTAAHSDGEIRGQIYRLAREGYTFSLEGKQQVPAVVTTANGSGIVSIDREQTNARFIIVAGGLSGALSGAHFHKAVAGQNGDVIFDLDTYFSKLGINDAASGYWKSTDASPFTPAIANEFSGDSLYVNIHTPTNPGGEIRGQVLHGASCFDKISSVDDITAAADRVVVYPNPVSGNLNVIFNALESRTKISVSDLLGNQVISHEITGNKGEVTYQLDLKQLTNGVYFVIIQDKNSQVVKRIIKN